MFIILKLKVSFLEVLASVFINPLEDVDRFFTTVLIKMKLVILFRRYLRMTLTFLLKSAFL